MIKIYGIKNCDTVKKALKFLDENGVEYHFHDYKKKGVDEIALQKFMRKFGWEKVINLKSRTWRALSDEDKATNESEALQLAKNNSSVIKRPILDNGEIQILGFNEDEYKTLF
jgi:arsenate reductase